MGKQQFRLLGLSGSLRRAAASTAILRSVAARMPADALMTVMSLSEIPIYNEDEDRPSALTAVELLRDAIASADGLVVISPEYNHGISGVLKNAIDWVSRPGYESVLKNKPVLVMSSATSPLGGARAQLQLRELFASTLSRVVARRQIVVGNTGQKIRDGELVDEAALAFIDDGIADLLDEIALLAQRGRIEPRGSLMRQKKSTQQTANTKPSNVGQSAEVNQGVKVP